MPLHPSAHGLVSKFREACEGSTYSYTRSELAPTGYNGLTPALSGFLPAPGGLDHRQDAGAYRLGLRGPDVLANRQVAWQETSHEGRSPAGRPAPCLSIGLSRGLAWPVTHRRAKIPVDPASRPILRPSRSLRGLSRFRTRWNQSRSMRLPDSTGGRLLPRQVSSACCCILTRRASEGSASKPALARRKICEI